MRPHRTSARHIPDWQIGCIDSKWRWSLPWGVFSTGLLVLMMVATSLWNHVILRELSHYANSEGILELSLRPADERSSVPGVLWIDSKQTVHGRRGSVYFRRTLAYHRRLKAKLQPITELYQRFSDVPWDE